MKQVLAILPVAASAGLAPSGKALDRTVIDFKSLHQDCSSSCASSHCESTPKWNPDACLNNAGPQLDSLIDDMQAEDMIGFVNETYRVCNVVPTSKAAEYQCQLGTQTSLQIVASALHLMARCYTPDDNMTTVPEFDPEACQVSIYNTYQGAINLIRKCAERMERSPMESMGGRIRKVAAGLESQLESTTNMLTLLSLSYHHFSEAARQIIEIIRWDIWRNNHWVWLQENLNGNGTIQEFGWGAVGRSKEDDAYDPTQHEIDLSNPPFYQMGEPDAAGMRWDIVKMLLKEAVTEKRVLMGLQDSDPDPPILVVEVGVFAGHFSDFLLSTMPNLQLVGIDPYIGTDGTFPGDYSTTLDPNDAMMQAAHTYAQYGEDRARLLPITGREAAPGIEDGTVDLVFADGCHFYECIKEDIEVWEPKLRPGGFFTGHDFSPQWPGVVRAVHEARIGQPVTLGMDWMYWWKMSYDELYREAENAAAAQ